MNKRLEELKQNLKKGLVGKILPLTLAGTIAITSGMPAKKTQAYNFEVPTVTSQEFEDYEYTKMFLGGRQIEFTSKTGAPYKKSKKVMVPLEAFADAYYALFNYDKDAGIAEMMRFGRTINVKSKSKKIVIKDGDNETSLKAKVATTVKNGKVYVQLSTLAEALGLSVRTDKKTGIIHVEFANEFENIDFKDKKLTTMKKLNKNSVNKLMLDMAEVDVDYIDVLKKSNQYFVFVDGKTAFAFSTLFIDRLDWFYGKLKEFRNTVYTTEKRDYSIKLYNIIADDRDYLNEKNFFRNICNMTNYNFCWKTLGPSGESNYSFLNKYKSTEYKKVFEKVDEIVSEIKSKNVSQREQIKLACDAICDIAYYDDRLSESDAYGALVRGNTVCSGYADAFQVIMEKLGIPSIVVTGSVANKGHAWNHVCVDGEWEKIDVNVYDINGFGLFTDKEEEGCKSYPQKDYNVFELT